MKFGVLLLFSWPDRRVDLPTVYRRALERVEIMDQTGYDAVWLAEHHFTEYSVCPSVHMMAMVAAERTKRLRIGTGISLVPFYNPLRLAEEVAMLDVLSGGRVNWGAGRGYQKAEYQAFDVDPDDSYERFREGVEIVRLAWTEERFSYHGRFWSYDEVEVLPKPLQRPHPPIWLAASSGRAIEWAADHGFSILMDPVSPHKVMREKRDLYEQRLASAGFSSAGRDLPVARLVAVAPTDQRAREVAAAGARWYLESHQKEGQRPVAVAAGPAVQAAEARFSPFPVFDAPASELDRFIDDTIIHGSPESCVDQILRLRDEIRLDYLLCAPLGHESFLLFTDRVLPALGAVP